jgi:hypothetical protein
MPQFRGDWLEAMKNDKIPVYIYHWQNDMVMVFNAKGEQIPEYQGPYEEAIKAIPEEYHYLIEKAVWPGTEQHPAN